MFQICSSSLLFFSLLFSSGQTAVKLSGAEAADRAQCAAPDKPIGYWNLLVAFANLKRVIQCARFKSLGSRKGTPKCNLRILAVAQRLWVIMSERYYTALRYLDRQFVIVLLWRYHGSRLRVYAETEYVSVRTYLSKNRIRVRYVSYAEFTLGAYPKCS